MDTPGHGIGKPTGGTGSDRLNVPYRHSLSGPEVGTTQDRKGDYEPDCEPRSGQGRRRSTKRKKARRGPERGPRSLGRYPFLNLLKVYLDDVRPYYSESTYREIARKLPHIHGVLQTLKAHGRVSTTNPQKLGQRDIGALLDWMNARDGLRSRPLKPATQRKTIQYLNNFLQYFDNGIIKRMKDKKLLRPQKVSTGPLPSPAEAEVEELVSRLQEAAESGCSKAFGVFGHAVFCAYAGTRVKEIRLANMGDYSVSRSELIVYHPKGEGSWGETRPARVLLPGRQFVADFLDIRAREFKKRGLRDSVNAPLVPRFKLDGAVQWSDAVLHNVKCEVARELGLEFDFRSLRRAFAQNAVDRGAKIKSVSRALGHTSIATTERSYARLKVDQAYADLDRVYASSVSVESIPCDWKTARWSE